MSRGLLTDLLEYETRVWDALVTGDAAATEALMDEGFLGVYPSGFATRACHVGQLADGPSVAAFSILEPRVMPLGTDKGLIAYRAEFTRPGGAPEAMYVSSVWRRSGEGWVNIFSQDTPAE